MRNIIFLDIDGVLNCKLTKDKICGYRGIESAKVALLKQLQSAMDAELVLTSTWRSEISTFDTTEMGKYLLDKLAEYELQIDDQTPDITWSQRALEIKTYLDNQCGVDKVLILDDEDFNYGPWGLSRYWYCTCDFDPVFGISDMPGLTQEAVDEILSNLNQYTYIDLENYN